MYYVDYIVKKCKKQHWVILIEAGNASLQISPQDSLDVMEIAKNSLRSSWYVVIAISSGCGWRLDIHDSSQYTLSLLKEKLVILESKNFSDSEAELFMDKHSIDKALWDAVLFPRTGGNPLLLSKFADTKGQEERYIHYAMANVETEMNSLVTKLLSVSKKWEFVGYLDESYECMQQIQYPLKTYLIIINRTWHMKT